MIAASGKWLGNSDAVQPALGAGMPSVSATSAVLLLRVGATAGHGSFADAMQYSREATQPAVEGNALCDPAYLDAGATKATAGHGSYVPDTTPESAEVEQLDVDVIPPGVVAKQSGNPTMMVGYGSVVADAKQMPANEVLAHGMTVASDVVPERVETEVEEATVAHGEMPGVIPEHVASTEWKYHPAVTVASRVATTGLQVADMGQNVSLQSKGSVASTEVARPSEMTVAMISTRVPMSNAVGRSGGGAGGVAVTAMGTVPKVVSGLVDVVGVKIATDVSTKSKPKNEAKGKVQPGKEQRGNASGGRIIGKVGDVGLGSTGSNVVAVATETVVVQSAAKTSIAVLNSEAAAMAGECSGKEKIMHPTGAAVVEDGKVLVQAVGVSTCASIGGDIAVASGVGGTNKVVVTDSAVALEVPAASMPATASVMPSVAVVTEGRALNLLPSQNATAIPHGATGVGMAASMQGVGTSELKVTTIEAAKPNQLEVGLRGGEFGWLKVRAELCANGEVNAFLRGTSSTTAEALQVAAPKIAAYLGANDVPVRAVHVESLQGNGDGVGGGGDAGSGNASQQQMFGGRQKGLANTATNEEGVAGVDEVVVPATLRLGRSVVSLTGTGNWLSVRA